MATQLKPETAVDVSALIQPGRVHRRVYSDPAIFDLEMARIFDHTWIYVGHESQVKAPGDFITTRIGRRPMVMVRHADGDIKVLHNQCAHRGAMVISTDSGNAEEFVCCYHGWTYGTDGKLIRVPLQHGYPAHFNPEDPNTAMVAAPRVDNYRGFVFASPAPAALRLQILLRLHDDLLRRHGRPLAGRRDRGRGRRLQARFRRKLEALPGNLCDAAHPLFVHQSSINAAVEQDDSAHTDGAGEIGVARCARMARLYKFWMEQVGIWTYPNGHSFLGDYHDDEKLVAAKRDPVFADYIKAMETAKGAEQTQRIMEVTRWNSNVYPNLSFMSQFRQLRVVHPISVNRTEVYTYSFRLKGAPEKMFEDTIAFANVTNGTGSLVLTDDLETYGRIGTGLQSAGAEWIGRLAAASKATSRRSRRRRGPRLHERGLYSQHVRRLARPDDGRLETWRP